MLPAALPDARGAATAGEWRSLGTPRTELTLDFTLPTGQSFRWRKSGEDEYTGVIGQRLVRLRQEADDVSWQVLARGPEASACGDCAALRDYFNLHASLAELCAGWAAADARFRLVHPFFPGARMLRQDPLECLFQFICSSNNHISRIHGMVERLCAAYGTPLVPQQPPLPQADGEGAEQRFYAFPTLQQLAAATEEELRAAGFGYRAKFITGTAAALAAKEGGGAQWLATLRAVPYEEAAAALIALPGVGPKVAACVCLFSLDKHQAIPVDTHVWQLAAKYYTPSLKGALLTTCMTNACLRQDRRSLAQGKTLNPKLMAAVEAAFIDAFGPYAGWAHNVLFISDLASQQHRLPPALQLRPGGKAMAKRPQQAAPASPPEELATEGKRRRRPFGRAALAQEALLLESQLEGGETLLLKTEVKSEATVKMKAEGLAAPEPGGPLTPEATGKRRRPPAVKAAS